MKYFKKGDKLVCLQKSGYWSLTKGKVYEASRDSQEGQFPPATYTFVIGDLGDEVCCHSYRFEKVGEPGLFEAVLPGFNGGSDDTDYLVKWVLADSPEQVSEAFPEARVSQLPWQGDLISGLDADLRTNK